MYEVTRGKLKRDLKEEEIEFLKWVYEKHVLEEMEQVAEKFS